MACKIGLINGSGYLERQLWMGQCMRNAVWDGKGTILLMRISLDIYLYLYLRACWDIR